MKTILLPLADDDSVGLALATSHLIAKRFASYIEGLLVRIPMPVPHGPVPPQFLDQFRTFWEDTAESVRQRFTTFMKDRGVPFRELSVESAEPTAWWREMEGEREIVVGQHGRLFDLIVVPRTSSISSDDWTATCEAALFETGRPVIVAPTREPETIGERVVVAWNGGTETARTLALGHAFLKGARSVTVIEITGAPGGRVPGPGADEVAAHLARGGVKAAARIVAAEGRSSGEAVLDEAHELGADLLVKGAYSHHRLRQMFFGGTTRHVLAHADMPVLIAH